MSPSIPASLAASSLVQAVASGERAREAARRWAVAVSGQPDIQLRFMRSSPLDMTPEEWEKEADALWGYALWDG